MYRSGSLTAAAARELARFKLDLLGAQQVRWDKGARWEQGIINFFMEKETKIITWERLFLYIRIVSAAKKIEFVSDRVSYIVLRGRWCNIIVLNMPAPSGEK